MKQQDVYGEPIIIHLGIHTARVYHPILTKEECERRMKRIAQSAAALLFGHEKATQDKAK